VNRARALAFVIALAAAAYGVLAVWRGWFLISSGDLALTVFGVAIIALPILGLWLIWREIDFGFAMQRMGEAMLAEGQLRPDAESRLPSGRLPRDVADDRFAALHEELQADPNDWRAWYRLSLAYDDARDRKQARAAMREARMRSPYS
jgi:tetratricopeptide (TPR) repeat protein